MSARDAILARIRSHPLPGEHPLPDLPAFPLDDGGDRTAFFLRNLKAMGGKYASGGSELIAGLFPNAQIVASAVPEYRGTRDAEAARPQDLAVVDVAVVRAAFAIAETGSVLLTDAALRTNAVAYLAQHLVVLVDPDEILLTTGEAYQRPELHCHPYASFHTGPSATADIEGVLIHGAQGVRSLTVLLVRRTETMTNTDRT